jgi:hypothetical protein
VFTTPIEVFTITDLAVHDDRSAVFTITDPSVHDGPKRAAGISDLLQDPRGPLSQPNIARSDPIPTSMSLVLELLSFLTRGE